MSDAALALVVLRTKNMPKVIAWYGTIGVTIVKEKLEKSKSTYTADLEGLILEFVPLPEEMPAPEPNVRLGFVVSDLDKTLADLKTLGTVVVNPPQSTSRGFRAVVRDPDGRSIELYKAMPPQPPSGGAR
jgi:lactoylglutathione lyase